MSAPPRLPGRGPTRPDRDRRYIARESGSRATGRNFVGRLRQKCAKLASAPIVMGRPRPELHPDIRSFPFGNYVIFFRYAADDFEVVKVIEGHRNIDRAFEDRD